MNRFKFMMQRVSMVSQFGQKTVMKGSKGIWGVTKEMYEQTKTMIKTKTEISVKIEMHFCISWKMVSWNDMEKPLHCGIAAALLLHVSSGLFLFSTTPRPRDMNIFRRKFLRKIWTGLIKSKTFFHNRKLTSIRKVFSLNETFFTLFDSKYVQIHCFF